MVGVFLFISNACALPAHSKAEAKISPRTFCMTWLPSVTRPNRARLLGAGKAVTGSNASYEERLRAARPYRQAAPCAIERCDVKHRLNVLVFS
jgi:hypothetical protein